MQRTRTTIYGLLMIAAFALLQPAAAQEKIDWMSWQEAMEANKENPKKIFVDVYTDWCGWCKKMDATTFRNAVIVDYMNEKYYAVKLDAEMKDTIQFSEHTFVNAQPDARRSTHQLAAALLDNRMSYPSFVILNEEMERMQVLPGFKSAKDFEPILKYFGNEEFDTPYKEYMKTFESEIN